jgi:hypothetical protein
MKDEKGQATGTNRRSFVKLAGLAGLGVAGAAVMLKSPASSARSISGLDIHSNLTEHRRPAVRPEPGIARGGILQRRRIRQDYRTTGHFH